MTTIYPPRVVAVAPGGTRRGFPYMAAAVYELRPRKNDGTLVYRRSLTSYAFPHRSVRLATVDAEELAERLGVPLWPHVRQWMTAEEAHAIHAQ